MTTSKEAARRHQAVSNLLSTRQQRLVNNLFYRFTSVENHQTLTSCEVEDAVAIGFWVAISTPEWNPEGERPMALVSFVARRVLRKKIRSHELRYTALSSENGSDAATPEIADKTDIDLWLHVKQIMEELGPVWTARLLGLDKRNRTAAEHTANTNRRNALRRQFGYPRRR